MIDQNWRAIFRQNFTSWEHLANFLELNSMQKQQILQRPDFPLSLPLRLAQKIQKGTLEDPILKQFLPTIEEKNHRLDFVSDPVCDASFRQTSKLLHKYEGRVLIVCSSACAMHCRYCFRQNFDYEIEEKGYEKELELIAADASIFEVILSGGDPLSLSERVLADLIQRLSLIKHVKRLRFHTRFPIGIPERIDAAFLQLLATVPQQIWFIVHINHAHELDQDILDRFKELKKLGVNILNQGVLLKGVNDDVETLATLCLRLVDNGIVPYYLHQLDRVQGAAHFEVSEEKGRALIAEMTKRLPGYAVPKYVKEIAGEASKMSL